MKRWVKICNNSNNNDLLTETISLSKITQLNKIKFKWNTKSKQGALRKPYLQPGESQYIYFVRTF